ncbi:MAG: impB/mucB/samB family protein [Alphaproteobacteria bacterium]|nr:impB/mucB/samB family protein [Alphaproteobacteria bacterium]
MLESPEMNSCKWLFFDLNSYFASVEQQERPELRGRPVAVVPMDTDYTCAIAASYEAKAYGVKTGTRIKEAKMMCPDLVTVLARHDKYVEYHDRILSEVIKHTPINKVCSVDELSSRLPPNKRTADKARAVALRLKAGLRQNLGEHIRCSIGIAPNAYLAKVATDMEKPDGLVILSPDTMQERLFALKLTDLCGINVGMEARLRRGGITSVEQFWHLSPKHARRIWGSVEGERFWYRLRGYEIPDQETKTTMIGHSRVLDTELRNADAAYQVVRRLTIKAATRLRRKEFFAAGFVFAIRFQSGQRWARDVRLSPAQDNFTFLKALEGLWTQMADEVMASRAYRQTRDRPFKVSISLHGLCRRQDITPDLFDQSSESYQALTHKNEALSQVMDNLNSKYGAETLRLGVSPKTRAGYVGTKIAFSRVPDQAEFFE